MNIYNEVNQEVAHARSLYPSNHLLLTAFAEEAGEVTKAVLDHYSSKGNLVEVKKELIQTMAMCIRLLEEGDPAHKLPPTKYLIVE